VDAADEDVLVVVADPGAHPLMSRSTGSATTRAAMADFFFDTRESPLTCGLPASTSVVARFEGVGP
jgi:hypothetical protein